MPFPAAYGLPARQRETPLWGVDQPDFAWYHDQPGISFFSPQYIPTLGLMATMVEVGSIDFRDPLTAEVVRSFIFNAAADAGYCFCYVPSCNKIVVANYNAGSGTTCIVYNLTTGGQTVITGLSAGCIQPVYCPVNDLVYVSSIAEQVHIINPWTEAVHTTATVSGTFGTDITGMVFSPVNGKLYVASGVANNIYRIDPVSQAIDATIASGGTFNLLGYADHLQKVLLLNQTGAQSPKTLDPLNADTVASYSSAVGQTWSAVAVPNTGEVAICGLSSTRIWFYNAAGTEVANVTASANGIGWNPVTQTVWAVDKRLQIYVIDPLTHQVQDHAVKRLI